MEGQMNDGVAREVDPMKSLQAMQSTGPRLAQAKADRVYLEEYRKSLKAILMRSAEKAGNTSAAAQEREAYADESYSAHLDGLKEAVRLEEQLRWTMVIAQAAIDVYRSMEATNRAMDRGAA
jgi:hypothetical protein